MVILHCMPPHQSKVLVGGVCANIRVNTASRSSGWVSHFVKSMSGRYSRPIAMFSLPADSIPSRACSKEQASGKATPESVNLLCLGPSMTTSLLPEDPPILMEGSLKADFFAAGAGDDASSAAPNSILALSAVSAPIDGAASGADGVSSSM